MAIQWESKNSRTERGPRPTAWGECNARDDAEFVAAFCEVWSKLVREYLTCFPREQWNSVLCGAHVYEGSFSFSPALDFDLFRQLPGCRIHFPVLEEITQADYDSDAEFEKVCVQEELRFADFIQQGWLVARDALAETLTHDPAWQLPLRIINSPELKAPPLLDTRLTLR